MEDFETKLNKLLFDKANHTPKPKESLELLLKHIYDTVLVPAHGILVKQELYASSTVSFEAEDGWDSSDEFGERPSAALEVRKHDDDEAVLIYSLSFDGDDYTSKVSFWSQVRAPYYVPELDADQQKGSSAAALNAGETSFEEKYFDTLDMKELVSQVQEDLFNSFEQFL